MKKKAKATKKKATKKKLGPLLMMLYARASTGKIVQWRVWVEGADICTEYGEQDGKLQMARKAAKPKNVGRANATTAAEQAIKEAAAMHKKQADGKYTAVIEELDSDVSIADSKSLPMLAHKLFDTSGKLSNAGVNLVARLSDTNPVDVQPKLNGMRALAEWNAAGTKVIITSRLGKVLPLLHIAQQLENWLPEGWQLDGELYMHDKSLQHIISLVKDYRQESFNLHYLVYDVPKSGDVALTWAFRREVLARIHNTASVKKVKCAPAYSLGAIKDMHRRFVERGFEGAMVRTPTNLYVYGQRSAGLLKVKAFQDAEFEVIGYKEGEGTDAGTAIFECRNDLNDLTFDARMKGDINTRKAYWENRDDYIGRLLTVQYFERTPKGLPHCLCGIAFQEDRQ